MGHDYSYNQPSSSYENGRLAFLLDEAESSYSQPVQYPPQPECDYGIPQTCYCGVVPVVATSYTSKDPGRRYFTCENAKDGDCHIWKWFDVAVMEELSDIQRQLRLVKDQGYETEHKLVMLEKTVSEFAKKNSGVTKGFLLGVCLMGTVLVFIAWLVSVLLLLILFSAFLKNL